jgi:hypothetical protein
MAANLMRTLNREQFEAGMIGSLDPPFGTDLEETLAQYGVPGWHLGKRQDFDSRTFVRLARVLDRVRSHVGAAPPPYLQGLAQRAPSPDKREGLR